MTRTYTIANVGTLYGIQKQSTVSAEDYSWGIRVADNALVLVLASGVQGLENRVFCLTRSFTGHDLMGWTAIGNLVPIEGARYY